MKTFKEFLPKLEEQDTNYNCGPAVILSLYKYFKLDIPDEDLVAKELKTTKKYGTNISNMVKYLDKHFNIVKIEEKKYTGGVAICLSYYHDYDHWILRIRDNLYWCTYRNKWVKKAPPEKAKVADKKNFHVYIRDPRKLEPVDT